MNQLLSKFTETEHIDWKKKPLNIEIKIVAKNIPNNKLILLFLRKRIAGESTA